MRHVLASTMWDKQQSILLSVQKNARTAVRSCHGAGKSWIAARVALWFLLAHKGAIVLTTAPTFRQVQRVIWKEFRVAYNASPGSIGGRLNQTSLELGDDWFALGFSTNDPDAFQGHHALHILVIFDEASGVEAPIWDGSQGVLSSEGARFLSIGNPTDPTGDFCAEFKDPDVSKLAISAFETPNFTAFGILEKHIKDGSWEDMVTGPLPNPKLVTPAWVAARYKRWKPTSPMYISRVLGEFPADAKDSLIPLSWVEAAQRRELILGATDVIELGVDVARSGDNETVITKKHGNVYRMLFGERGMMRTTQTVGVIEQFIAEYNVTTTKVDSDGVGGGVADGLYADDQQVYEFHGGESATDSERYHNLRAEAYWGLRERFDPDNAEMDIDEDDEELAAQLCAIKWKLSPRGKIQIESKEDSDHEWDRADALMIAASGGSVADYAADQFVAGKKLVGAIGPQRTV